MPGLSGPGGSLLKTSLFSIPQKTCLRVNSNGLLTFLLFVFAGGTSNPPVMKHTLFNKATMLHKNGTVAICIFFCFSCFQYGTENLNLSEEPICFLKIFPADKAELIQALEKHMRRIAVDFKQEGRLYEAWQNDNNSDSLRFFFNGHEYNLRDAIKLVREIAEEVEFPVLLSNTFELYMNPDAPLVRNDLYHCLLHTLVFCIDICIAIEDTSEFIAMVMAYDLVTGQICIYDFVSCYWYTASKRWLVERLGKVEPKRFSRVEGQLIIVLLNKISTDTDMAFNTYLVSERAVLATRKFHHTGCFSIDNLPGTVSCRGLIATGTCGISHRAASR